MERSIEYFEMHAAVCKTFGHPKRLMIISVLMDGELCVTEISKKTGIAAPNLSQHLHILKDKGILQSRRNRNRIFYSLAHPNIRKALELMSTFLDQKVIDEQKILSKK